MFNWASKTFDKLSQTVAPPPTDGAGRFAYSVQRGEEDAAMGCIAEIDPVHTVINQAKGWYPIHMACQNSCPRLIRLLLNQPGISIEQSDLAGHTPLHHACMSTSPLAMECVKILIADYGASVVAKTAAGKTPYDVCSVNSIRQYLLPLQLQAETQIALDNGGHGLPPGIDLGGLRVNNAHMPPPPTSFGMGHPAGPAGMGPPPATPPPHMFGTPTSETHSQHKSVSAPSSTIAAVPLAPASGGQHAYSRCGSSSAAMSGANRYRADGFHSSSSDVGLQKKYGNAGNAVQARYVPPPPSSGNSNTGSGTGGAVGGAPLSGNGGANPFAAGVSSLGTNRYGARPPASRYVAYGPNTGAMAPAPVSGPAYSPYNTTPLPAAANYSMFTPGGGAAPAAPVAAPYAQPSAPASASSSYGAPQQQQQSPYPVPQQQQQQQQYQQQQSPYAAAPPQEYQQSPYAAAPAPGHHQYAGPPSTPQQQQPPYAAAPASYPATPTTPYMPPPPYQSYNSNAAAPLQEQPQEQQQQPHYQYQRPDFVSPAAATYGSPATPGSLDTPGVATPAAAAASPFANIIAGVHASDVFAASSPQKQEAPPAVTSSASASEVFAASSLPKQEAPPAVTSAGDNANAGDFFAASSPQTQEVSPAVTPSALASDVFAAPPAVAASDAFAAPAPAVDASDAFAAPAPAAVSHTIQEEPTVPVTAAAPVAAADAVATPASPPAAADVFGAPPESTPQPAAQPPAAQPFATAPLSGGISSGVSPLESMPPNFLSRAKSAEELFAEDAPQEEQQAAAEPVSNERGQQQQQHMSFSPPTNPVADDAAAVFGSAGSGSAEQVFGSAPAAQTSAGQNASELTNQGQPTNESLYDGDDDGMLDDVPLTPSLERPVAESSTGELASQPASPPGTGDADSLFAAIGMKPPPFSAKRR